MGPARALEESVGPALALEERRGPGPGPWRAGKVQEKRIPFFFEHIFTKENIVFGLQTTVFYGFSMLLSFLAEKCYRTIMKSPQKPSFGTKMCSDGKKNLPPPLEHYREKMQQAFISQTPVGTWLVGEPGVVLTHW